MARRFINQLTEGESVEQIFLVADKQVRANRSGNLYLQLRLADKSGSLTGMLWNANEKVTNLFEAGDYLTVKGTTQFYNGSMQLIITSVDNVDANFVREEDFVQLTHDAMEKLKSELFGILDQLQDPHLKCLIGAFRSDADLMDRFCQAPAGIKNHHAYQGGLLVHVVSMLKLARFVGDHYDSLNVDLLMAGVFLHDIGKIRELSFDREFAYTDEGQLIGHLQIGAEMVQNRVDQLRSAGNDFPDEKLLLLKHLILSHHGLPEYGTVKLPMTLEAIALHYIDTLDSKLESANDVMNQDVNEGNWTSYQPAVGRKYFKGSHEEPGVDSRNSES